MALYNVWTDLGGATGMVYVVQTANRMIERCILMTTDPGDLVLDPTCGSGTTAYVAEHWGAAVDHRRYLPGRLGFGPGPHHGRPATPTYLLADSRGGQLKEAELSRRAPSEMPTYGNVRQGFVYERVPHITLRAIANNAEIGRDMGKIRGRIGSAALRVVSG